MRTGFDKMRLPLVQVWCRRCHGPAGLWCADATGAGVWQHHHRKRRRCDPPPTLPEGKELDELGKRARRSKGDGKQRPVSVSR
jgi:hypothetical protein